MLSCRVCFSGYFCLRFRQVESRVSQECGEELSGCMQIDGNNCDYDLLSAVNDHVDQLHTQQLPCSVVLCVRLWLLECSLSAQRCSGLLEPLHDDQVEHASAHKAEVSAPAHVQAWNGGYWFWPLSGLLSLHLPEGLPQARLSSWNGFCAARSRSGVGLPPLPQVPAQGLLCRVMHDIVATALWSHFGVCCVPRSCHAGLFEALLGKMPESGLPCWLRFCRW